LRRRAEHAPKPALELPRAAGRLNTMTSELQSNLAVLVLAQTVDAVIYADAEGVIRLWNPAAEKIFGFSSDDAIGASLDLIIPERLRAAHWRGYRTAVTSGTTRLAGRAALTKGLHKSGRHVYVEMSFSVVKDSSNHVIGSVAIARDVTDKHVKAREASAG
jgi:PAS domain S-box-containing protein